MKIAILENEKVINIVVGDPKTVAELFLETQPVTEETGIAWIGARFNGKKFEPRCPYDSWVWNEDAFDYDPPVEKPEGPYRWIEEDQNWKLVEPTFSSWTWDESLDDFVPPVPLPQDGNFYEWDEATLDWVLFEPTDTEA